MTGLLVQTYAVARNAFAEVIRQPFYAVWLMVIGALIVMAPYLSGYTFDDDDQFAFVMMLSTIQLGGMILAAVLPALVIRREIDNQTALTVVSKPIARPTFVIGKYLGVAGAMLLIVWSWSLLFLLMDRHGVMSTASDHFDKAVNTFGGLAILVAAGAGFASSYWLRRPFGSAFAKTLAVGLLVAWILVLVLDGDLHPQNPLVDLDGQKLAALVALWMMMLLLSAVAVAAGMRLALVPALIVVILVAGVGFTNDYFFGTASGLSGLLYRVLPNFQFMFLVDAITNDATISAAYLGNLALYTLLLIIAVLSLAVALFQTRNVT